MFNFEINRDKMIKTPCQLCSELVCYVRRQKAAGNKGLECELDPGH